METFHVVIVGGGIAGLYAAYRLRQAWESEQRGDLRKVLEVGDSEQLRILILERNPIAMGGRIRAAELPFPGGSVRAELGAMRITTRHRLARRLFDELGVERRPFEGQGFSEHFFLRGKHFNADDFKAANPTKFPYVLEGEERGKDPGDLVKLVLEQALRELTLDKDATADTLLVLEKLRSKVAGQLTHDEWREIQQHGLLTGRVHLKNLGVWNLIHHYLSPEAASFVEGGFGYESIIGNWNVSDAIPWFIADFTPGQGYEAIEGSFVDVVGRIRRNIEAQSPDFRCKIVMNAQVTRLERPDGGPYRLKVKLNEDQYTDLDGLPESYSANVVFLALPRRSLESLEIEWIEDAYRKDDDDEGKKAREARREWEKHLGAVRPHRLAKIVQGYQEVWWRPSGAPRGASRTFTDLPLRQVYYLDREWLQERGRYRDENGQVLRETPKIGGMIVAYLDGHYTSFWRFITAVRRIQAHSPESAVVKEQEKREWFGNRIWAWREPERELDALYSIPLAHWTDHQRALHLYFTRYGLYERASLKMKHILQHLHKPAPGTYAPRTTIPEPAAGAYTFWDNFSDDSLSGAGWHTWESGVDSADEIRYMVCPFKKQEHKVYVCGEAYSSEQGWIEGALKSVELVMDELEILLPDETMAPNAMKHVKERSDAMRDYVGLPRRPVPQPPPVPPLLSAHVSMPVGECSALVFISGKIGFPPPSRPENLSFEAEAGQALDELLKELDGAGGSPSDLISVRAFLRTMDDYQRFNRVYSEKLQGAAEKPPVRTVIAVRELPLKALVEVDGIAVVKRKP
jgi:enamine deaminase RidA (YjgF/YER057c/UK114 family)